MVEAVTILLLVIVFFDCLRKESEVHLAVMALLHEVRMFLKVLEFVVFQNEHAAFTQKVVLKYEIDQFVAMSSIISAMTFASAGIFSAIGRAFFCHKGICFCGAGLMVGAGGFTVVVSSG